MSRPIEFRAWDTVKKVMMTGIILAPHDIIVPLHYRKYENDVEWMQFTGLTDKNGKEIYEGDIVRYFADALPEKQQKGVLANGPFANEPIHVEVKPWEAKFSDHEHDDFHEMVDVIRFQDGAFWCENNGGLGSLALVAPNCEVIGNIHENPDLLEGESSE